MTTAPASDLTFSQMTVASGRAGGFFAPPARASATTLRGFEGFCARLAMNDADYVGRPTSAVQGRRWKLVPDRTSEDGQSFHGAGSQRSGGNVPSGTSPPSADLATSRLT